MKSMMEILKDNCDSIAHTLPSDSCKYCKKAHSAILALFKAQVPVPDPDRGLLTWNACRKKILDNINMLTERERAGK